MSWYLATAKTIIDQFASGAGLVALKAASKPYRTLSDFFDDGTTRNVAICIVQLDAVARNESDADVKATAKGLAKLMDGQSVVFITQGFGAPASVPAKEALDAPMLGGLKHPKHANVLGPIRSQAATALKRFFKRQGQVLLTQIKPRLREADDPNKKAADIIPSNLPIAITGGTSVDYSKALSNALAAGYEGLAGELGANADLDEDIVQTYLSDHSLTKLTGDFEETTVHRLRNALADAYDKGADFEGLVDAIKEEYAGFSDIRAGMIAQTEMNAAYNAGRKQLGLDLGFNEKAWDPDGTACEEICVPNVLDGWIDMDEEFESGDSEPPGHPNCDCSLNVRFNADAE